MARPNNCPHCGAKQAFCWFFTSRRQCDSCRKWYEADTEQTSTSGGADGPLHILIALIMFVVLAALLALGSSIP